LTDGAFSGLLSWTAMPTVFGRYSTNPHPFDPGITDWLTSGKVGYRAMARNIMHDHRVIPEREERFIEFIKQSGLPSNGATLEKAVVDYYKEQVRDSRSPPFTEAAQNSANILTNAFPRPPRFHPNSEFGRILKLNPLWDVFDYSRRREEKDTDPQKVTRYTEVPRLRDGMMAWLDKKLVSASAIETFVHLTLDAMNVYLKEVNAYQPSWCAPWSHIEEHLRQGGPERAAKAVGLPSTGYPSWVIVLRYKCWEAGTICRPCQLDAGWWDHHFPSPPQARPLDGGHPMDCQATPTAQRLLSEYIHPQFSHKPEHWKAAGRWCVKIGTKATAGLDDLRRAHHGKLGNTYGQSDISTWMPDPV
jgi:hypothetical protein